MDLLHECHEGSLCWITEHGIVILLLYEGRLVTLPGDVGELGEERVLGISSDCTMSWIVSDTTYTDVLAICEVDDADGHLVLGECSCLIRTDSCDSTECLDG